MALQAEVTEAARIDARCVVWRKRLHRLGALCLEGYDSKCLFRHIQANVSEVMRDSGNKSA